MQMHVEIHKSLLTHVTPNLFRKINDNHLIKTQKQINLSGDESVLLEAQNREG